MIESRRGFLVGAAKLIGAGLTLAMVPDVIAETAEPLLWTPEQCRIDKPGQRPGGIIQTSQTALVPGELGNLYVTVSRAETPQEALLKWGIGPHGTFLWKPPLHDPIVFSNRKGLTEVFITTTVMDL
jgi:hypothetical protein